MKVQLGDKVKDPITGIEGIAWAYITYMHGCERVGIQQPAFKNEKGEKEVPDLYYVDDPQCVIVKRAAVPVERASKTGGPSGFQGTHKPKI